MTVVSYLSGWLVLLAVTLPAAWAAVEARRLLLPDWAGSWAALVVAVGTSSLVLIEGEALGTFGLLRPLPLVALSVVVGCGLAVTIRRRPRRPHQTGPALVRPDPVASALAAVVVVGVLAQWTAWTLAALRRGITGVDALLYHSTFAARFAQTGSTTRLHQIVPGEAMAFYPANSELWHALGMVAFRRDVMSPFLNLVSLVVALVAAWAFGRRWGGAPAAVVAVGLVAAVPYFAYSAGGTTFNDAPAVAALLCAVVLVSRAREVPAAALFAALAAGLAAGMKLSFLAPALLVMAAAVWMAPRQRFATGAGWLAAASLTGGYWFVRNLFRVGNPLPALRFGLPAPTLPVIEQHGVRLLTSFRLDRWATVYHPGIRDYFGRPWLAIVLAILAGAMLAVASGGTHRVLGVVCVLAFLAYLVTPITGDPVFFRVNIRYAIPVQLLALLLLATAPAMRARWPQRALVVGALITVAFAFPDPASRRDVFRLPSWPPGLQHRLAAVAVVVAIVGIRLAVWGVGRLLPPSDRGRVALAAGGLALVSMVVAGRGVANRYTADRYQRLPGELGPAWRWAQGVRDARIGLGGVYLQYPFTGPDLSNQVQYVGLETPHHGFEDAPTCRLWREAVNRGHYRYVVTSRDGYFPPPGEPPEAAWTRTDPAAHQVLRYSFTTVFELTGRLNPAAC